MPKKSNNILFKLIYSSLAVLTILAVATPPAIAANLLPDTNAGALIMVSAIALLMLVLVFEIWRQTGKNASPALQKQIKTMRKNRLKH